MSVLRLLSLCKAPCKAFPAQTHSCQQNRRARLAIDFSTDLVCISHAFDVLGVWVMIASALLRTETECGRGEYTIPRLARSYRSVSRQAWHSMKEGTQLCLKGRKGELRGSIQNGLNYLLTAWQ